MRKRASLFKLYRMAEVYGMRPSEIVGIDDDWAAYQFDAAAMLLGQRVQTAAGEGEDVDRLLGIDVSEGGYRSPTGLVTKTMKIPESGVW